MRPPAGTLLFHLLLTLAALVVFVLACRGERAGWLRGRARARGESRR
ncbi:MAG: hypothetical protein H6713_25320 [Myxococcales bacterium]|nr:hypothetical protein [Myxococcales bacterium]MCB9753290.1 hypothetical protein [Myxococcales bacterium]